MEKSDLDDWSTTTETISVGRVITRPMKIGLSRTESEASIILDPERSGVKLVEALSRKLPSSRYKGVIPQPNGRWGAQIYKKHLRVWLGTFNTEEEAAKAYDVAVRRFRDQDAITNFKPTPPDDKESVMEATFLSLHSKSEIVDMLRKHTYNDELAQSKRTRATLGLTGSSRTGSQREHLFQKTVTPSDVGRLNRLVIPKQHAEKHFPVQKGTGVLLHFEDYNGSKVWRFRYSYWNSSQSYVLTRGWSRFVKEKKLKAGDSVSFESSSSGPDKKLYINWKSKTGKVVEPAVQMLRLFGVDILSSGKRIGDTAKSSDLLGFDQKCKRQRVINVL